jgi:hypothetical protein
MKQSKCADVEQSAPSLLLALRIAAGKSTKTAAVISPASPCRFSRLRRLAQAEARTCEWVETSGQVWKLGLAIAPVPFNLKGKARRLVGLGICAVNAQAGGVDGHTDPTRNFPWPSQVRKAGASIKGRATLMND